MIVFVFILSKPELIFNITICVLNTFIAYTLHVNAFSSQIPTTSSSKHRKYMKSTLFDRNVSSKDINCENTTENESNDVARLMKRQMQLINQQYLIELPEFDADSDVYPIFYQQFITTTENGGFDDAFNLIRLRKVLKGVARQAVIVILALPKCLRDVLAVLEKRFGSPEVIVKRKLKKLSNFSPLNENKPQIIRQFYEYILGLIATLRAC